MRSFHHRLDISQSRRLFTFGASLIDKLNRDINAILAMDDVKKVVQQGHITAE